MKVTNLMLMSLDGEISSHLGENSAERLKFGFTIPEDQELLHAEIQKSEAIIIGAESVRSEGGVSELKASNGGYPLWCVLSNTGLDPSLHFWKQTDIPRILISKKPIPLAAPHHVELLSYGTHNPGFFILEELKRRGISKVLLLGGGKVNQIFYNENLVDELKLTLAPWILGKGISRFVSPTIAHPRNLQLVSYHSKGSHLFLHYKKTKSNPL